MRQANRKGRFETNAATRRRAARYSPFWGIAARIGSTEVAQFAQLFIIRARGETPVRIGLQ
ncbi:hypothetical protein C0Z18_25360 [Trinickia dabaoshanensis]|uniref:Uncharacterized protein n=1 Tax=Trinickia dabaoshanensis TaxID=564714 RepID=A0A2N7VF85_9BURK|nr:hypothetical protein C0Z18_25360 [Trinickia dabaoshanensis]